jgi:hypothetical protein
VPSGDPGIEVFDPLLRLVQLSGEEPQDLSRHLRQLALGLPMRKHPRQVPGTLSLDDP